ncbi:translocation/assembly module TamB domain-containing protein [Novosphingobium tardum]|uniref:Translocation/assembly module TamB domain-containing protein n=1 Tax=Novosphingobium tardum TaxID=1538021 RepID=A0ABV8RP15_9SPHN
MDEVAALPDVPSDEPAPRRHRGRRWARRGALLVLGLLAAIVAALLLLDSQIGHRLILDKIAGLSPNSGLKIEVGRIEGSIYDEAILHDLVLKDPDGTFMTVPEADLKWRPLSWLKSGLDIRSLVLHRGELRRLPHLRPGDPNAPMLPQFDIRVDHFAFDRLTVDEAVAGVRRRIDLVAKADIRSGRLLLDVDSKLGGNDAFFAKVDAMPDADKFDVNLLYRAAKGGLLAGVTGAQSAVTAQVFGKGSWTAWRGGAFVTRAGQRFASFRLHNRAGRYSALGELYPGDLVKGTSAAALGKAVALGFDGTFKDSVLTGKLGTTAAAFKLNGGGAVDFARNRFDHVVTKLAVTRPELLLASPRLGGVRLAATLDGAFRDLSIDHVLTIDSLDAGATSARGLRTAGVARWDGARLELPLDLTAEMVVTGNAQLDPRFAGANVRGNLVLAGQSLSSDNLAINLRGLAARLALRGDIRRGGYALSGPVTARGFALPNLGLVDADAKILFKVGSGVPWTLAANAAGRMVRVDNATLASLAGSNIRFSGGVTLGQSAPLLFRNARLNASKLALAIDGRRLADGTTTIAGRGRHVDYGPFTVEAALGKAGPSAVLVFADPYPAAGLADVRVALSPIANGFRIVTSGGSRLGPFDGTLGLFSSPGGPTRIAIERMKVWQTDVTGQLLLGRGGGISGNLALNGGGLDGTIRIDPRGNGQAITALVTARDAHFGGPTPLAIADGRLEANGFIAKGRTSIDATLSGEGISSGRLFIGRFAANAKLVNGSGDITASITGRRGSRFALSGTGRVEPNRIVALAGGEFAGRRIVMPRRAVLTREGDGWRLSPTQIGFGQGILIASGHVLGGITDVDLKMAGMPLSIGDIVMADLGLGGRASGLVTYRAAPGGIPTGSARLMVKGLTRSGLVLTSRPVDLALVAQLSANRLETRAVIYEGGETRGRLQARIAGVPPGGSLVERLSAGNLFAQLRYSGPADALWRLAGVEAFDLTGPVAVAADATGSIANPQVRGAVASTDLRIQSALSGTDLRQVAARGRFNGSQLYLSSIAGTTPGGGRVVGSGSVDLSNLGTQGPGIDLRLAAANALLVNRDDMAATVTGPLRIVSNGNGGTIAGRLRIDKARWQLGRAAGPASLPVVATREINQRADIAPARAASAPWNYLIDARAPNRVDVRGLGLDSEWSADIRLRGAADNPRIFGGADLVRGGYEFAGKRFELSRGRIRFAGEAPPDPQLDLVAQADVDSLSATITIQGTSSAPEITFSSVPALPEEELLARILFGSSITNISAVEALQLGSAVASLRGGGGLDPINKLRSAIGLDRLRIVGADATTGRGTSIAVGKYLGRRFFVEIVTDGQGYSATQLEFRITRWLALLASISTLGDESINARVSKDY